MEDFKAKVQAELDTSKLEQQLKNLFDFGRLADFVVESRICLC